MSVLVAYASRHGATAGIAERLAARLRADGLDVDCLRARDVRHPEAYDAFVVGSASYMFRWLGDASRLVRRHSGLLRSRPVWLFSSGPLGTDRVDEDGRDVLEVTRPKEFDELTDLLHPRGERVFFGAYDPDAEPVGFGERLVRHMPAAKDALPTGDFRDWAAIEAWAREIAESLGAEDGREE